MSDYTLSEVDAAARTRLDNNATWTDPLTMDRLAHVRVASGWHCAEIGAGTGTIAAWLADRVGPRGGVLATDLDTRWLDALGKLIVEVRRHDIATEQLEAAAFDLVHCRNVLTHVSEWRTAIDHMIESVRPGGWLCVEEPDWIITGLSDPPTPALESFWTAVAELTSSRGGDPSLGRKLGAVFYELGLADVGGDARAILSRAGLGPQLDALGPALISAGLLSESDLAAARREVATPGVTYTPLFVCLWGRRPHA